MAGIYIHVPFCKQACHYCDFYFSTNAGNKSDLVRAMADEIELQQIYLLGNIINTIYFGGGTPSLLQAEELGLILNTINKNFKVSDSPEITIEVNPDDLSQASLADFKMLGINRLSIGIQSFDDSILKFLNRAHNAKAAGQSIEWARKAGFDNISIDLIYSIPGQDNDLWRRNIDHALRYKPEHISAYSLTIEEKTAFGNWLAKGKLKAVEDDIAARQLEILMESLEAAGYLHYEISNFSKPGFESRHNSNYWKQEKYLGIGPSAHSFNFESRQANISNNHLYVKSLRSKKIPFEIEYLTKKDRINEYILTTLRTSWGTDLNKLKTEFAYDIESTHNNYLTNLINKGIVQIKDDVLSLTKRGKLLADKISSDLFLSNERI
jgi:oxygen-independent coproporphyrinogen-3 oxidase